MQCHRRHCSRPFLHSAITLFAPVFTRTWCVITHSSSPRRRPIAATPPRGGLASPAAAAAPSPEHRAGGGVLTPRQSRTTAGCDSGQRRGTQSVDDHVSVDAEKQAHVSDGLKVTQSVGARGVQPRCHSAVSSVDRDQCVNATMTAQMVQKSVNQSIKAAHSR